MTERPPKKNGRFRKEDLVTELMALGHRRITAPIARLVADEVEDRLKKRKITHPSPEVMGELVAAALQDLGLVRSVAETQVLPTQEPGGAGMPAAVLETMARAVAEEGFVEPLAQLKPLNFSESSLHFLEHCLCRRDDQGRVLESVEEVLRRVASVIARAETRYQPQADTRGLEVEFYNLMASEAFLPELKLLQNVGEAGFMASGHVGLTLPESLPDLFDRFKIISLLHQQGVKAGLNLTRLMVRPRQPVSGPLAVTRFTDAVLQALAGGHRDLADRYYLRIDHPHVLEWLTLAADPAFQGRLSLGLTSRFLTAVENDGFHELIDPVTLRTVKSLRARPVFKKILGYLYEQASPDLVFVDTAEEANPTPRDGLLEGINADGDQLLLENECLPAGFINLYHFVADDSLDFEGLRACVREAVHFLENAIEVLSPPLPGGESLKFRKMALGVMGWAEVLAHHEIPYDSPEALQLAGQVMGLILAEAQKVSGALASRRGTFAHFDQSPLADMKEPRRHALLTALCACSLEAGLLGVSPGIDPISPGSFKEGSVLTQLLHKALARRGLESWIALISQKGEVDDLPDLPHDMARLWTSRIRAEAVVLMQKAFAAGCEGGVFASIPLGTSLEEAGALVLKAFRLKLKSLHFVPRPGLSVSPAEEIPGQSRETLSESLLDSEVLNEPPPAEEEISVEIHEEAQPEPPPPPPPPLPPPSRHPRNLFSGADYFSVEEGSGQLCPVCASFLELKGDRWVCAVCGPTPDY